MKDKIKNMPVNRWLDIAMLVFLTVYPLLVNNNKYRLDIMSGIIAFIIFAISLDLLWGYSGLMSMGHSVQFGLGGYIIGMSYAIIKAGREGTLPDYMLRFEMKEIPWFLKALENPYASFVLALLIPGVVAFILGYFMFSGKINGVFFCLITLAFSGIMELFLTSQQKYTNGGDGIGGIPMTIIAQDREKAMTRPEFYYTVLLIAVAVYLFCLILTKSRFGKILQSIRENESRLTFFGYNPASFKIVVYIISGMLAGLSGVLYTRVQGVVTPSYAGISMATVVLVWIAVGGRGNLTGAILGTFFVRLAEVQLSSYLAEYWKLILGFLVLAVVFFMPKGVVGTMVEIQRRQRDKKKERAGG